MANKRYDISIDEDLGMQMKEAAFKKYGNSKSFSLLIENMFMDKINNKQVINVVEPHPATEMVTEDKTLTPEEIAVLNREPEIGGETDGSCNLWAGPWICTSCWGYWTTINVPHPPMCCPSCGGKDEIKRRSMIPDGMWESHAFPELYDKNGLPRKMPRKIRSKKIKETVPEQQQGFKLD